MGIFRKEYWYLTFRRSNGQPVAVKLEGCKNKQDAQRKGFEKLSGIMFEVFSQETESDLAAQQRAKVIFDEAGISDVAVTKRPKDDGKEESMNGFHRM